jgi:serine/threonine-protein kinase
MSGSTVMSRARWERIQALFEEGSALAAEQREAWIAEQCGADSALRDHVAALLRASVETAADFENKVDQAIAGAWVETDVEPGKVIGRYRVVRLLGHGGMGAVYLAERADEQFTHQVALKIIGRTLPTHALARRFRAERQILAHLNHPNVARLLDGGASEDGVPYLAMEYVEGTRIDVYCEAQRLDVCARLRLFQQVCAAVQYAHQNLVVHRDIKPSNILVTRDNIPKLLDFGIAKLLDPSQTNPTDGLTRVYERVLTPQHASPEQLRGEPIGTVSDIYSLGVLLYELLARQRPYSVPGRTLEEVAQLVCTIDPPRPSVAAKKAAEGEGSAGLSRALSGDLDNIVMRAMHKDAQRRYPSAAALSEDIQRFLEDRPVHARPDAWTYRTHNVLRRNRLPVTAAAAASVVIALLVTFYTIRLAAERDRATLEAVKSQQVAAFLTDLFRVADPAQSQGRQITALELLDRGAQQIDEELASQPRVRADLLSAIGLSYKNLSSFDRARPLLEQSLAIKAAAGLQDTRQYARTLYELANLRRYEGNFAQAERDFKEALEIQRRIFDGPDEDTAATLTHLGVLYYEMQRLREALSMQQQALTMTRAVLGEDHVATADRMNNLALVLQSLDRYRDAERYLREAIRIQRKALGERHPDTLVTRSNLALLLRSTGRYQQSEALLRELLPLRRAVLGAGHPSVGLTLTALGGVLTALGKFDEAEQTLNEAIGILTAKYGADHWRVGAVLRRLGELSLRRGDPDRAEEFLRRALAIDVRVYGDASTAAHTTRAVLASALMRRGEIKAAQALLEGSYAFLRTKSGLDSTDITWTLQALGQLRIDQQRYAEAVTLLEQALRNYQRIGGPANPDAAEVRTALAQLRSRR